MSEDKKKKKVADIIKNFGGTEKFTKRRITKRSKHSREPENKFSEQIAPIKGNTLFIDIAHYPTTTFGYKYLLVATDPVTREFDIEPMKNKDSDGVLKAFLKMTKRDYIDMPKYFLVSDNGSEFQGVFQKYLYDESIFHKQALRGRHKQLAVVDNLINTINRIINAYMTKKEVETNKVSKNWYDVINTVRTELNEVRKVDIKKLQDEYEQNPPLVETATEKIVKQGKKSVIEYEFKKPRFKVGQKVYRLLELPKNALGEVQTGKFRTGDYRIDEQRREIKQIVQMNGQGPTFRYILEGIPNVSYEESELRARL
jgi:hypothetical protein